MKHLILITLISFISLSSYSQYRGSRMNGALMTSEEYVTNSPGNSASNSKLTIRMKDSTYYAFYYPTMRFMLHGGSRNDGTPTSILWTDNDGNILRSPLPSWLTSETDPIWNADKSNYYTKTTSDGRYLQSFVEADPTVPVYAKSLTAFSVIKTSTDPLYLPVTYTPSWTDITSKPTTLSGYGITDATSNARAAISITTTGTSGSATYNNTTGVINVPNYTYTPAAWSFNNSPGRSIVSVAAAANGFQISSTRNADVTYSATITTTVSLSGNSTGYIVLEICPTNSSTAGDWIEVSRVSSGQSGTLVVGLVLTQTGGGSVSASVPAGYYTRLRSVNTTGTPTYAYNSGQEVLK